MLGRKITVSSEHGTVASKPERTSSSPELAVKPDHQPDQVGDVPKRNSARSDTLRARALDDTVVKAMLEVFSAEIDDVQKL